MSKTNYEKLKKFIENHSLDIEIGYKDYELLKELEQEIKKKKCE